MKLLSIKTLYYSILHLLFTKRPGSLYEITFAGTPATVEFSGTSFTATDPALIEELFPIFTFSTIHTLGPMYTLSPIIAGVFLFVPIVKN